MSNEQFNTGEEFPSVDTAGMNIGQHAQHLKTIGKQPTSAAEILKDDNVINMQMHYAHNQTSHSGETTWTSHN